MLTSVYLLPPSVSLPPPVLGKCHHSESKRQAVNRRSVSQTQGELLHTHYLIPPFSHSWFRLQTSTESMQKLPGIILSISWKGIKFVDGASKVSIIVEQA